MRWHEKIINKHWTFVCIITKPSSKTFFFKLLTKNEIKLFFKNFNIKGSKCKRSSLVIRSTDTDNPGTFGSVGLHANISWILIGRGQSLEHNRRVGRRPDRRRTRCETVERKQIRYTEIALRYNGLLFIFVQRRLQRYSVTVRTKIFGHVEKRRHRRFTGATHRPFVHTRSVASFQRTDRTKRRRKHRTFRNYPVVQLDEYEVREAYL